MLLIFLILLAFRAKEEAEREKRRAYHRQLQEQTVSWFDLFANAETYGLGMVRSCLWFRNSGQWICINKSG